MTKEKLNRLLDSIYELEGLVHLAISRDDEPSMLPELIMRKSLELNELVGQTVERAELSEEKRQINEMTATEEVVVTFDKPETAQDSTDDPDSDGGESADQEPEEKAADELKADEEKDAERAPVKETYRFDDYVEPRGRLVFSINDRYRFKRELFKGSDVEFNTTLSLVASMEGYEEAEDYFLNELQWDEKSPDVIDFLEILKNYYK